MQLTLFPPDITWKPPRLADLPQDWRVARRVSLDTETCDTQLVDLGPGVRRGAYICGVSFQLEGDRPWYLPVRHLGGGNMEEGPEAVMAYLRAQLGAFDGELVGARLAYDLDFLWEEGCWTPNVKAYKDVQVAEPLLDELQYSYSLNNILKRHNLPQKDEAALIEAARAFGFKDKVKLNLHKLDGRYVGAYGEGDVSLPLQLLELQEKVIEEEGLQRVWTLGQQLLPVLVRMRRRGVRVDFDQLDRVERYALAEENKAWGEVQRLTGVSVKVGEAMKVAALVPVFEKAEIPMGRTAQGKPSITKDWLESLNHPVGKIVRRARKMSQLRSTFVNAVRRHVVNGRIHCTFNQTVMHDEARDEQSGAAFGRLSCQDLNMQQQPARDPELGPMWRKVYLPEEGAQWCCADYSQQEPGFALHYALKSGPERIGRAAYEKALEAAERKRSDPNMDYHDMFTSFVHGDHILEWARIGREGDKSDPATKEAKAKLKVLRDPCKNIYLGICYGEGEVKLCRDVGYPTVIEIDNRSGKRRERAGPEGRALLELVDQRVPYIRRTANSVKAMAQERGYVVTIMGRRCHFERDDHGNLRDEHKAFNRIIQGGAAEQTQQAMVDMDREGIPLQLQVHDEMDWPVSDRREAERGAELMAHAIELLVPIKVDVELGPSWGEIA